MRIKSNLMELNVYSSLRVKWIEREKLSKHLKFKGLYKIYMFGEKVYVGMSCNQKGIAGRFKYAQQAILGLKNKHSGFESMLKFYGVDCFLENAEVEILPFIESPETLAETHELHGRIKYAEEFHIAKHIRLSGKRPKFNKI